MCSICGDCYSSCACRLFASLESILREAVSVSILWLLPSTEGLKGGCLSDCGSYRDILCSDESFAWESSIWLISWLIIWIFDSNVFTSPKPFFNALLSAENIKKSVLLRGLPIRTRFWSRGCTSSHWLIWSLEYCSACLPGDFRQAARTAFWFFCS